MDNISKAIEAARTKLPTMECRLDEPMMNYTSFRIGGPVRAMFFPSNADEIMELHSLLHEYETVPLIIGNGTNLLINDSKTLEMVAIKTTGLSVIEQTNETDITAGAGVSLSKLAIYALECGLTGLEYAHGIPGSLGGAISMNAGAFGGEMKDVVHSTSAFRYDSGMYSITNAEHGFSYRRSRFSDIEDIILSSVIRLQKGDKDGIKAKMDDLYERRRVSQPLELPSGGSAFKRPKDGYAADLIERAGLKGFSIGGAQVSQKHSGFIVNNGGASFTDIMTVINYVIETVYRKFNVELEPEYRIVDSG